MKYFTYYEYIDRFSWKLISAKRSCLFKFSAVLKIFDSDTRFSAVGPPNIIHSMCTQ